MLKFYHICFIIFYTHIIIIINITIIFLNHLQVDEFFRIFASM